MMPRRRNALLNCLATLCLCAASQLAGAEQALSRAAYDTLETVREQLEAGAEDSAIRQLDALIVDSARRPYDKAVALQMLGHAYLGKDDYVSAIDSFKRSLALQVLGDDIARPIVFNLAQLYLATAQYPGGIALLEDWIAGEEAAPANAWAMLGSAYAQVERYTDAVKALKTAIDREPAPAEAWYQGLLGAYYALHRYKESAALLEEMIRRFPQRGTYWKQLAAVQVQRERYVEALSVMELAWRNGHLENERELLQLAGLYIQGRAPAKAARLLEAEMDRQRVKRTLENLKTLSAAWQQAQEYERAAAALADAVALTDDPRLELRLARMDIERDAWDAAAERLSALCESDRLESKEAGDAWLLLGIADLQRGRREHAADAFRRAREYPGESAAADQWLAYLDSVTPRM